MTVWVLAGVAILGWVTSARWYFELWKWSKQYSRARIIVYYKNRYQMGEPLSQWLAWWKTKDSQHSGRIIWSRAGVSIGIANPQSLALTPRAMLRERLTRRRSAPPPAEGVGKAKGRPLEPAKDER